MRSRRACDVERSVRPWRCCRRCRATDGERARPASAFRRRATEQRERIDSPSLHAVRPATPYTTTWGHYSFGPGRTIGRWTETKYAPSYMSFSSTHADWIMIRLIPFNPNRNKVGDVQDALAAEVQLPEAVRAPAWIDARAKCWTRRYFACSNGLLHLPTRTLLPHTPIFFSVNAVEYAYERGVRAGGVAPSFEVIWGTRPRDDRYPARVVRRPADA